MTPKLIVGCVYIPPSCPDGAVDVIAALLRALPLDCELLLTGDFNAPDIDWITQTASSCRSSMLCELFFELNLVQLVDSPTHQGGSILDLVLTNTTDRISGLTSPLLIIIC